jgi:hypothetical protein
LKEKDEHKNQEDKMGGKRRRLNRNGEGETEVER